MSDSHQTTKNSASPIKKSTPTTPQLDQPDMEMEVAEEQEMMGMGGVMQRAQANPQSLKPPEVMQLQRLVGNRAVNRLLSGGVLRRKDAAILQPRTEAEAYRVPKPTPIQPARYKESSPHVLAYAKYRNFPVQAKLTVGPVADEYEKEADRVASQVMSMPSQPMTANRSPEGQQEDVQMKPLLQRLFGDDNDSVDNEDELQAKPLVQRVAGDEDEQNSMLLKPLSEVQGGVGQKGLQLKRLRSIMRFGSDGEEQAQMKPLSVQRFGSDGEEQLQMKRLIQREVEVRGRKPKTVQRLAPLLLLLLPMIMPMIMPMIEGMITPMLGSLMGGMGGGGGGGLGGIMGMAGGLAGAAGGVAGGLNRKPLLQRGVAIEARKPKTVQRFLPMLMGMMPMLSGMMGGGGGMGGMMGGLGGMMGGGGGGMGGMMGGLGGMMGGGGGGGLGGMMGGLGGMMGGGGGMGGMMGGLGGMMGGGGGGGMGGMMGGLGGMMGMMGGLGGMMGGMMRKPLVQRRAFKAVQRADALPGPDTMENVQGGLKGSNVTNSEGTNPSGVMQRFQGVMSNMNDMLGGLGGMLGGGANAQMGSGGSIGGLMQLKRLPKAIHLKQLPKAIQRAGDPMSGMTDMIGGAMGAITGAMSGGGSGDKNMSGMLQRFDGMIGGLGGMLTGLGGLMGGMTGGIMAKPSLQREFDGSFQTTSNFETRLHSANMSGNPLPETIRRELEPKFGADFSGVRIHTDSQAVQLNREVQARAFTHGAHIHFGAGEYNPGTSAGKGLLAHELTHVVQQTGAGKISPKRLVTLRRKPMPQMQAGGRALMQREVEVRGRKPKTVQRLAPLLLMLLPMLLPMIMPIIQPMISQMLGSVMGG